MCKTILIYLVPIDTFQRKKGMRQCAFLRNDQFRQSDDHLDTF